MNIFTKLKSALAKGPDPSPINDDPTKRGDRDYRRSDDDVNVVRVNQPQPKGFPRKQYEYVPVAGTSYRQNDVVAFINGHDRAISLRTEVVTFSDGEVADARAVYGQWLDESGSHEALLGYVPAEINEELGGQPCAARLEAMFRPDRHKSAGIRMSIWVKRQPSSNKG
jgi:hypothetical protein